MRGLVIKLWLHGNRHPCQTSQQYKGNYMCTYLLVQILRRDLWNQRISLGLKRIFLSVTHPTDSLSICMDAQFIFIYLGADVHGVHSVCVCLGVCVEESYMIDAGRRIISVLLSPGGSSGSFLGASRLAQLTVATAASSPSSTLAPLPMAFILAMMSVNVSFTVFSRIQPSLSLSGSSGLASVDRELFTYCRPMVTPH